MQAFKEYVAAVEILTGKRVKTLRSDGGGEYINHEMVEFCRNKGIRLQTTHAHSPFENGVAERYNRTLLDMTRCLLVQSGLGKEFWEEAMTFANTIHNIIVSDGNTSPEQLLLNKQSQLALVKSFGCLAYVYDSPRSKLEARAKTGILLGFNPNNDKRYRILLPEEGRIIHTRMPNSTKNYFQQDR